MFQSWISGISLFLRGEAKAHVGKGMTRPTFLRPFMMSLTVDGEQCAASTKEVGAVRDAQSTIVLIDKGSKE